MSLRGHYRQIIDAESDTKLGEEFDEEFDEKPDAVPSPSGFPGVVHVTSDDFIPQIEHLMRRTRGSELPGTFNPMIVADLFVNSVVRGKPSPAATLRRCGTLHLASSSSLLRMPQMSRQPRRSSMRSLSRH